LRIERHPGWEMGVIHHDLHHIRKRRCASNQDQVSHTETDTDVQLKVQGQLSRFCTLGELPRGDLFSARASKLAKSTPLAVSRSTSRRVLRRLIWTCRIPRVHR
jgi:hypothetical protein